MMQSGVYPLPTPEGAPDWSVSAAGTFTGAWQEDLEEMTAFACQVRFLVGTPGNTVRVYLQTSLDQGMTAFDVAVLQFDTISRIAAFSVVQTSVAPADEFDAGTQTEGIDLAVLGDRLRLKLVVDGAYTNTTLSARFIPR